jgi:hypothetical protein
MAEPDPGLFGLLFSVVRTDRRRCDEDQLTVAVAGCCRMVPGLARHLAFSLFGVVLDGDPPDVETQCTRDAGVRYDLVLGAGRDRRQRGLVLEHKLESGFASREVDVEGEDPEPIMESQSQVQKYLDSTSNWHERPRVGAIVKYRAYVPPEPADPRWRGFKTWTEFKDVLDDFDCEASDAGRVLVPELHKLLLHMGAVMLPVPPEIDQPMTAWSSLNELLRTAVVRVTPAWEVVKTTWRPDGFWIGITRVHDRQPAALSFRTFPTEARTFLSMKGPPGGPLTAESLTNAGFVADEQWEGWYLLQHRLELDFRTHTEWSDQLKHAKTVLEEALGRAPSGSIPPLGGTRIPSS